MERWDVHYSIDSRDTDKFQLLPFSPHNQKANKRRGWTEGRCAPFTAFKPLVNRRHLSDDAIEKSPSSSLRAPSGNRSVNKRTERESAERTGMGDGRRGFRSWEELSDRVRRKTSCRKSCSDADKNTSHCASLARSYTSQKSSHRLLETWVKAVAVATACGRESVSL